MVLVLMKLARRDMNQASSPLPSAQVGSCWLPAVKMDSAGLCCSSKSVKKCWPGQGRVSKRVAIAGCGGLMTAGVAAKSGNMPGDNIWSDLCLEIILIFRWMVDKSGPHNVWYDLWFWKYFDLQVDGGHWTKFDLICGLKLFWCSGGWWTKVPTLGSSLEAPGSQL